MRIPFRIPKVELGKEDKREDFVFVKEGKRDIKKYISPSQAGAWEGVLFKAITTERMFIQKSNYIHYNPVKRGLAAVVEDYELSSARDYYLRNPGRILIDELEYDN